MSRNGYRLSSGQSEYRPHRFGALRTARECSLHTWRVNALHMVRQRGRAEADVELDYSSWTMYRSGVQLPIKVRIRVLLTGETSAAAYNPHHCHVSTRELVMS